MRGNLNTAAGTLLSSRMDLKEESLPLSSADSHVETLVQQRLPIYYQNEDKANISREREGK